MLNKPDQKLNELDRSKPVIVFGGARTWEQEWNDFEPILTESIGNDYYIAAVNNQISRIPDNVEFYFTLHPEKSDPWLKEREENGYNMNFLYIGHRRRNTDYRVDYAYPDQPDGSQGGSSGCYAPAILVKHFGFYKIILVGIPMTNLPNAFRQEKSWRHHHKYMKGWKRHFEIFKGKVKSTSGWTMDVLGYPKLEWIKGEIEDMEEEYNFESLGEVLEQSQQKILSSLGKDELDNLFEVPEIEKSFEEFVLHSLRDDNVVTTLLKKEYSGKFIYALNDGTVVAHWDDRPTKKEIREILESQNEEKSVEEQQENKEETKQESNITENQESEKNVQNEEVMPRVEKFMKDRGYRMLRQGHAPRNVITAFLREYNKKSTYKDVVQAFGSDEFPKATYEQILSVALELD